MKPLKQTVSAWKCRTLSAAVVVLFTSGSGALAATQISEPGRRAISPEIAVGADNAINVIWLDKGLTAERPAPKPRKPGEHSHRSSTDLYFTRSEDGGQTWAKPARVNEEPGEIWGFSVSKPKIEVGPTGTIHIFYPANDVSEITGKDIVSARYRRSTDNGKSFSPAQNINRPVAKDQSEILGEGLSMTNSFGTMGVAPDGTVFTAWQNMAEMAAASDGADGMVAISTDDGKSFAPARAVIPGNDVCPCCQLTLAFSADTAYMGVRKIFADGRDSFVARSSDGGKSFPDGGRLDFARWDIDGCPLKPTELAISEERIFAAAYTGGESPPGLYFSVSADGGDTFIGRQQVHPEAGYSDAPALTVDKQGHARLVWHAKVDGPRRLFTAVSTDGGETLSKANELATPAGTSAFPASAITSSGTVFVTWQQENEEVFVLQLPPAAEALAINR
jgi:hypothetical protein